MPELTVNLFGKFTVQVDGKPLAGIDSSKVQELLAYLLIYRDRPHPREGLAALLWEATSSSLSKKYLRQALWQLQNALLRARTEQVILIEPDWIRIAPQANLWLDVAVFEDAFALAQGIPGHDLDAKVAETLERTVALYREDLLEGWYPDWCLYERERLQNIWLAIVDKLMDYCEVKGSFELGLAYGARILRKDRARERTHRRLMRLAYLAGDRTGALRQYQRCVLALEEELGVKPAKRTEDLYRAILADSFGQAELALTPVSPSHLARVAGRLSRLRSILAQVREHVSEDLDVLERALSEPE